MKPGDRVIRLRSPGQSFLTGRRVSAEIDADAGDPHHDSRNSDYCLKRVSPATAILAIPVRSCFFKTEVLLDIVDSLYRRKHSLTVTGMRDLVELERLHPAIVRRLDDMCRSVEL